MARVELSTDVQAPPQAVFDYVDTHDNYPEFMYGFSNFEATTPRHQVGTRLKMEGKAAGITLPMEIETTEVVPGRKIAWRFSSGLSGQGEWRFEPVGDATRAICVFDYELPMGIPGQIADRVMLEREVRSDMEKTLSLLKEKVEAKQRRMAA
ncbi:MAG: SRPBCC family protein [Bacteroidetes bacterium]|nr:SRPBCC family protein [Bacteroidota bacterium]MCL5025887.1 SRPBCC family protein [Chloroflexota bacterium]